MDINRYRIDEISLYSADSTLKPTSKVAATNENLTRLNYSLGYNGTSMSTRGYLHVCISYVSPA